MKRAAAVLISMSVVVGHPASADVARRSDPADVRGPLDVARISHGHTSNGKLWHKVVMQGTWGKKALGGSDEIRFYFTNDVEDRYDEVHASVDVKDGRMRAWIFPYTEGSDYAGVGPSTRIRLVRPDRRSVKIVFDASWMKNRRNRYAWSVGSEFSDADSTHCRATCYDYAPGRNPDRLVHDL